MPSVGDSNSIPDAGSVQGAATPAKDGGSQPTGSQPSSSGSNDAFTPPTPSATARTDSSGYQQQQALDGLDDVTQLVRLETISDDEARRVIASFKVASVVSVAIIIVLGVLKSSDRAQELFVLNKNFHAANLAAACVLLFILSSLACCWLHRLLSSCRAGRIWSERRKQSVRSVRNRLVVLFVILLTSIITNAAILADPALLCSNRWLAVLGFIRWSGYNTFLMLLCIDGHAIVLTPGGKRKDAMVRDQAWTYHWPKYIYWAIIEGFLAWSCALAVEDGHQIRIRAVGGGPPQCEWGAKVECDLLSANIVSTALVSAGFCGWSFAYAAYLYKSWSQLKVRVYQEYRIVNMFLQIQLRFNAVVFAIFIVVTVVLWFTGTESCVQYALGFFGVIPKMLILTALQCSSLYLTLPRLPSDGPPKPLALLQQFAWTEASKVRKMQRRCEKLRADDLVATTCPCLIHAPMFCFETAIKSFYWSAMIYDYTEAEGHVFQNLPETIRELLGEIETAMRLFGLVKRHLFYDRVLETKVLVAWNERLIVVCARGSAEVANFVADAQILQVAHPPKRKYQGRTPRVHAGFLRSWEAHGVKERVLDHIAALVDSAADRSAVRVLFTGHSLGGAIASLAAFDFVRRCNLSSSQVSVYTFGCPRVGNHAFAEEYMEAVPDTWHIINNQDIVTHRMKVFGWYKRAGHRVIINDKGDCIVRPCLMELSLLQSMIHGCVRDHHNAAYQRALLTIVTNQLRESSRHSDGLTGLLELLKAVPLVRDALQTHAAHLGLDLGGAMRSVSAQNSERLSKSQQLSLMRHAGVLDALDADEDDGEHVAVGFLEEGADDVGDAPDMQIAKPMPATVENVANLANDEAAHEQRSDRTSRWHPSRLLRMRSQMHERSSPSDMDSAGSNAKDKEAVVVEFSTAAGTAGRCNKKCYNIPEEAEAERPATEGREGEQKGEPAHDGPGTSRHKQCRLGSWTCPLTCEKQDLPSKAQLQGSVVGIGAAPTMATCRLNSTWAKLGLAKQAALRGNTHACGNVLDAAPAARPQPAKGDKALDTCPVAPDVEGPLFEDNTDSETQSE